MENIEILRIILNSIYKSCWVKIQYKNKDDIINYFWISVKDIDFDNRKFVCDSLSLDENKNKVKEISVFIDRILEAHLLEDTCFAISDKLIEKIENNYSKVKEIFPSYDFENILSYLEECVKYDTVPYKTDIETVWGIDQEVLKDTGELILNDEQKNHIKKFMSNVSSNSSSYRQLGMNLLSINYSNNKQYVLVYRQVKWDVTEGKITLIGPALYNPQFYEFLEDEKVEHNIGEYLTEDQQSLLDDFDNNYEEIFHILSKKLNNKDQRISDVNDLLFIERNKVVDIQKEYQGIRDMYFTNSVSSSVSAFFGELEAKKTKFNKNGFCFVNNKLNPAQIFSIFQGIKDDVSFIQGPPGTGKTSTVVNTVTTAFFNKMKVLVVTNNNKPMKDLKKKFDNLGFYKNEKIELPVCRLSAKDKMKDTIIGMKSLYEKYKDANVKDNILEKNSTFQKQNLKDIITSLNEYDSYMQIKRRNKDIDNFKNKSGDTAAGLSILLQTQVLEENEMDYSDLYEKVNATENTVKSFLYFNSAKCIQKLKHPNYEELRKIIDIDINNNEAIEHSIELFIEFLKDDLNVKLLLDVFPIVLSTNLSSNKLGSPKSIFDICIVDEAGQCNVATSLIPIIRSNKLMLVGDIQQLRPVILLNTKLNDELKEKYSIKRSYNYIDNSIYSTMLENAPIYRENLLNKHYRCHHKIINFCNEKYYRNKLDIESNGEEETPLEFIDVKDAGNSEKNTSLNEVKEIIRLLQREDIKGKKVGVITPYVVQRKLLEKEIKRQIKDVDYDVGTIHTFQGDEKEVIIFSTAITKNTTIGTYNWLKSNKQLINVAVSRAQSKLILLANEEAINKLHEKTANSKKYTIDDIYDLYKYVVEKGEYTVIPNTICCEALGTEEEGNFVDKEMFKKIALSLSVITEKSRYKERVEYKELLEEDVTGKFDFVIYNQKNVKPLAIQIIKVTQKEEEFNELKTLCSKHNVDLLLIQSEEIRSYFSIKDLLKIELKKKQ